MPFGELFAGLLKLGKLIAHFPLSLKKGLLSSLLKTIKNMSRSRPLLNQEKETYLHTSPQTPSY